MMNELTLFEIRASRFMCFFLDSLITGNKEEQLRYAKLVRNELRYLIRDYEEEEEEK